MRLGFKSFCIALSVCICGCGGGTERVQAPSITQNDPPPTITAQPVNQTVNIGQTATFGVTVTGTPPFNYTWQKNGSDISGATGASYTTPPTTSADNLEKFDVIVTNQAGSATSTAANLTVLSSTADATAPVFVQETDQSCGTALPISCGSGTTLTLPPVSVTASAGHAFVVLVWFNDTPGSFITVVNNNSDSFSQVGSIPDTDSNGSAGVGVFLAKNIQGGQSNISVSISRPNLVSPTQSFSAAYIQVRDYQGVVNGVDQVTTSSSSNIVSTDVGTTFGAGIATSLANELCIAVVSSNFPILVGNGSVDFSGGPANRTGGMFVEDTAAATAGMITPEFFISQFAGPGPDSYSELVFSVY